jgi:hypothetical protein
MLTDQAFMPVRTSDKTSTAFVHKVSRAVEAFLSAKSVPFHGEGSILASYDRLLRSRKAVQ